MENRLLIFCLVTVVLSGCDTIFCSKEKPTDKQYILLEKIQKQFIGYKITFDDCLPLGYINVQNKIRTKEIDTLRINEINDSIKDKGFSQWLQVFDGYGVWKFQQKRSETAIDTSYTVLTAGDL